MELIPFNNNFGGKIEEWNRDPSYRRFFCSKQRFLTLEECFNYPKFSKVETLIAMEDNEIIGMVDLWNEPFQITKFSILIDKNKWDKGFGEKVLILIQDYCFKIKGTRLLMTHASTLDLASHKALEKNGFNPTSPIYKFMLINGEYEDVKFYTKLGE